MMCAIYSGMATNGPMTVSKLSEAIGVPRPTVYRKFKRMQDIGLAGIDSSGGIVLSIAKVSEPSAVEAHKRIAKAIRQANQRLSELDS